MTAAQTTNQIGQELEKEILNQLKSYNTNAGVRITQTKGSGNQRGDSDIKICVNDDSHTPLVLIDGKNSHSTNGSVPRKTDVDKVRMEARKHGALIGGIIIRKGTDNKAYAACDMATMMQLLAAVIDREEPS